MGKVRELLKSMSRGEGEIHVFAYTYMKYVRQDTQETVNAAVGEGNEVA